MFSHNVFKDGVLQEKINLLQVVHQPFVKLSQV